MKSLTYIRIITLLTIIFLSNQSIAQSDNVEFTLAETIFKQDSLLFNAAFITQDSVYLKKVLAPDLEFYHDKGGLSFKSSEAFINGLQRNWKRENAGNRTSARRKLIKESMEVFPLNNYGVVQIADHKFYEVAKDGTEELSEIAKIVHLWKETSDGWKMTRIISYDHQFVKHKSFEVNAALEEKIKDLMAKYNVPTVGVGLINDNKITYSKTFGTQSDGTQADENTFFKVASITKPIFATSVLKLVDMGLWDLDEPLHTYFVDPDIASDPRHKKLTTRLALNMKTGLPNWRHLTESKKLAFIFNPGEKVEYSGEGFEYVRKSIEAKFNTPFEDIIQRLLFDKQGMNTISFSWKGKNDPSTYAENYNAKGEQYETETYFNGMAAGNILATVDDYLKFGVHVLEGAGITNTLFTEMTTPTSSLYKDLVMYGFGWMNVKLPSNEKMIYHDGRDPGVRTIFQLFPESKQGVVILTNGDDGDKLYYDLLKEISPKTKEFVETYVATRKMAMEEMKAKKQKQ